MTLKLIQLNSFSRYIHLGQNGKISISHKLFSKTFHVWNYLRIYSCFETRLSKNQVSNVKLDFWIIELKKLINKILELEFQLNIFKKNSSSIKENSSSLNGTRVPWMELEFHKIIIIIFFFFLKFQFVITRLSKIRVLHWNSILRKTSFKTGTFS